MVRFAILPTLYVHAGINLACMYDLNRKADYIDEMNVIRTYVVRFASAINFMISMEKSCRLATCANIFTMELGTHMYLCKHIHNGTNYPTQLQPSYVIQLLIWVSAPIAHFGGSILLCWFEQLV